MYMSRVVLNQSQIDAINWRNLRSRETGLLDFSQDVTDVTRKELQQMFRLDKLGQEPRYGQEGNLYSDAYYEALKRKINGSLPDDNVVAIQHAVAVKNGLIRAYPTMSGSYREQEIGELDRFSVSILKLGEPVYLYCQDTSGIWCFVRTAQVCGWVLRDILALEPDEHRWQQYCANRQVLIAADNRRRLDYTDFDGMHQIRMLMMGTKLPLYDSEQDFFLLGMPAKDKYGNLAVQQMITARDGGMIPGPMPLCAKNIISLAKKMLGEPYGWGGSEFRRDCTSFIADVYSVFGLMFPCNSIQQMRMQGVEPCPEGQREKQQFIRSLLPGSVLYFPGHAMLYLGEEEQELQILHSVYAIGIPAKDRLIPHKIRRIVQGELSQRRVSGERFLDAITHVWAPDHQKAFLK